MPESQIAPDVPAPYVPKIRHDDLPTGGPQILQVASARYALSGDNYPDPDGRGRKRLQLVIDWKPLSYHTINGPFGPDVERDNINVTQYLDNPADSAEVDRKLLGQNSYLGRFTEAVEGLGYGLDPDPTVINGKIFRCEQKERKIENAGFRWYERIPAEELASYEPTGNEPTWDRTPRDQRGSASSAAAASASVPTVPDDVLDETLVGLLADHAVGEVMTLISHSKDPLPGKVMQAASLGTLVGDLEERGIITIEDGIIKRPAQA